MMRKVGRFWGGSKRMAGWTPGEEKAKQHPICAVTRCKRKDRCVKRLMLMPPAFAKTRSTIIQGSTPWRFCTHKTISLGTTNGPEYDKRWKAEFAGRFAARWKKSRRTIGRGQRWRISRCW